MPISNPKSINHDPNLVPKGGRESSLLVHLFQSLIPYISMTRYWNGSFTQNLDLTMLNNHV